MALIVETGQIIADADSYMSLDDARTLAAKYGWVLPADDTEAETALRNGAMYADSFEPQFCGSRVSVEQDLAWPRKYVSINGFDLAEDSIPKQVKLAQVAAAVEYGAGTDVRANDDGKSVTHEEVVGAVVVEYADNGKTGSSIVITKAVDALQPLLCGSNAYSFNVFRG